MIIFFTNSFLVMTLSIFFTINSHAATSSNRSNNRMMNSVDSKYCHDINKASQFISKLNQLSKENRKKLRKGSFATYRSTVIKMDPKSKKIFKKYTKTETHKVIGFDKNSATIQVTINGKDQQILQYDLSGKLYNKGISSEDPESCIHWAFFADAYGKGRSVKVKGSNYTTLYRRQALIGNTIPSYRYSYNIPFDLVEHIEKVMFDDETRFTEKKLVDFSF